MPHKPILLVVALAFLAVLTAAPRASATGAPAAGDGVSVAVHTSGSAREGQRVSYAIEVRNPTDRALPRAVMTQQLPPNLAFVTASPTARHEGRHLTWSLRVPAHGVARITMTGSAGRPHRFGSADQVMGQGGRHAQIATTVCVREDAGAGTQACATGRSALRTDTAPRWRRTAAMVGFAGAAAGGWWGSARVVRSRRLRRVRRVGAT